MANRMYVSLMVLIVLVLLFHMSGLLSDQKVVDCKDASFTSIKSLSGYLLNTLGVSCPQNIGSTEFYTTIALLTTIAVGGIIIGSLVSITPDIIIFITVVMPLTTILFLIGWDIIVITNVLWDVNPWFAMMIGTPMIVTWIFTVLEFALRKD